MPVWAAALIAVGAIAIAIEAILFRRWVLRRPKVAFAATPVGFWAFTDTESRRYMYIGLDVELANAGTENSAVAEVDLKIRGNFPAGNTYSTELVSESRLHQVVPRDGRRVTAHLLFRMPEPEPYRASPKAEGQSRQFSHIFNLHGELRLRPSENRRLFWGRKWIIDKEFVAESSSRGEKEGLERLHHWASSEGLDLPESLPGSDSHVLSPLADTVP